MGTDHVRLLMGKKINLLQPLQNGLKRRFPAPMPIADVDTLILPEE
jgi:hypothetical protein